MSFHFTTKKLSYCLAIIAALLFGIFWSVGIVALILGIVASFLLLKYSFGKATFASALFLLVCSFCFYGLSLVVFSLGLWLLVHTATLTALLVVTSLALITTLALLQLREYRNISTIFVSRTDIIAVVSTLVLVSLIFIPVCVRATQGLGSDALLGLVDGNVDDGAHLALINDRVQYNQGILTKTPSGSAIRTGQVDNGAYPVGWHAANAAIAKAIFPNISVGTQTLYFYIASKLFWFTLLAYTFFHAGITFAKTFATKQKRQISTPFVVSLLGLFAIYFLIDQFRLGFYSFIPQMLGVLLLSYGLLNFKDALSDKGSGSRGIGLALLPLIVFGLGGGLSWTLLLPAIGVPVVFVIVRAIKSRDVSLRVLLASFLRLAPVILGALAASLAMVYMMRVSSKIGPHVGFIDSINTYGLISIYNQAFFAVVGFGAITLLALEGRSKSGRRGSAFEGVGVLAVALLVEAAAIYLFQLFTAEVSTYYYFKSLNAFFVLAIPLAVVGMSALAGQYLRGAATYTALFVVTLVYIGFPAGNSPTVSYLKGEQNLDARSTQLVLKTLSGGLTDSTIHSHTIYFDPSQPRQTDIANVLMRSIPLYDDCFAKIRPSFTDSTPEKAIVKIINRECPTTTLRIYSPIESTKAFESSAESVSLPKNVHFYDLTRQ